MNSNYEDRHKGRWVSPLILIIFTVTLSAVGQRGGRLSSQRFDPADFASSRPQLLNAGSNPTLRYPIVSFSGISVFSASYGWLDVSREAVHYNAVSPPNKAKYQSA